MWSRLEPSHHPRVSPRAISIPESSGFFVSGWSPGETLVNLNKIRSLIKYIYIFWLAVSSNDLLFYPFFKFHCPRGSPGHQPTDKKAWANNRWLRLRDWPPTESRRKLFRYLNEGLPKSAQVPLPFLTRKHVFVPRAARLPTSLDGGAVLGMGMTKTLVHFQNKCFLPLFRHEALHHMKILNYSSYESQSHTNSPRARCLADATTGGSNGKGSWGLWDRDWLPQFSRSVPVRLTYRWPWRQTAVRRLWVRDRMNGCAAGLALVEALSFY